MRTFLATASLLVLLGCNRGSNPTPPPAPPALATADLAITVDNAIDVARAGVRGCLDLLRISYIGARFLQTTFPEPTTGQGEPTVPTPQGPIRSIDVFGPDNGVATFTWNDVDGNDTYTSNDDFTVNFDAYGDQGMTFNGIMTIDNMVLQGILPGDGTYIVDADLNLLGLTVTIGAIDQTFDTTLPFHLENRIIVELFDLVLLEEETIGEFEVQRGSQLSRYTTDETLRYVATGGVHSASLEGIVLFSTPTGLRGSPFLTDPIEGTLVVHGAANSSLELEPFCLFPGVCLSLDVRVDADGDAMFEDTQSTSWSALLPQPQPQ